jgi:hypothetical protein
MNLHSQIAMHRRGQIGETATETTTSCPATSPLAIFTAVAIGTAIGGIGVLLLTTAEDSERRRRLKLVGVR